jgi:CheY-like chemotaxis protein
MARILVVDDNPELRFITLQMLHHAGFIGAAAEHGSSALEELRHGSYDAIILDMDMPVMDGIGFLRVRANDAALSAIPVVVFSGKDPIQGLGGISDWVSKPCTEKELISAVTRAIYH